jgi:hypothetical protein
MKRDRAATSSHEIFISKINSFKRLRVGSCQDEGELAARKVALLLITGLHTIFSPTDLLWGEEGLDESLNITIVVTFIQELFVQSYVILRITVISYVAHIWRQDLVVELTEDLLSDDIKDSVDLHETVPLLRHWRGDPFHHLVEFLRQIDPERRYLHVFEAFRRGGLPGSHVEEGGSKRVDISFCGVFDVEAV